MRKQLTGKRDDTPLHSAVRSGNLAVVLDILENTEEGELRELLAKQNSSGETALYVAAEYGYVDLVREMIRYYDLADAGIKARNGFDAFHIAAKEGDMNVLNVLMEAHPELTMTVDLSNTTALHAAANEGHIEVVNFLLDAGSSLATIARSNGKTALHSAARNGHLEVVKSLLEKEPGIATRVDKKGQTALHMAAKGRNLEVVGELIKADPSLINMADNNDNTALHVATRKGRAEVVGELIKADPSFINMADNKDNTSLDIATRKGRARKGRAEVVGELIKADPSFINMADNKDNTSLDIATRKGRAEAIWDKWAFLITALCLEILSLAFDQASSPSKPHYAVVGMILAFVAVIISLWELIHKAKKERAELRRWGLLWWFYHPHSGGYRVFGSLPEIYTLLGGISQCICSTFQYVWYIRHRQNPIQVSLWPAIFVVCLAVSRLS